MEKRHNYAAAGFLLLGIGAAGRAFLGVPEGVTMAELSLTVLLVIGALLLTRQGLAALVCGLAATALELVLCGSWVQAGGVFAAAAPFLRLTDLWLLLGHVHHSISSSPHHSAADKKCGGPRALLPAARRAVDDLKYTRSTRMMLVACGVLLAAHTVLRIASLAAPASVPLGKASSGSFVVFSVLLLWYTVLMVKAYNVQRTKH